MVRRPTLLVTALLAAALSVAPATPGAADANEAPTSAPAAGALSIGGLQTCTIVTGGGVRCWGGNTRGELGLGALGSRGGNANQMGGNLEVVGLGTGRTATALSAGTSHTCAVLDTGQVKCWGLNEEGQLGLGNTRSHGLLPRSMGDELPAVDLGTGRTATAVSAGGNHTCAVLDNGAVKCWGRNRAGSLGLGDSTARGDNAGEMGDSLPEVDLGTGRTATAISAGADAVTCALLDDGTVKCWGDGGFGQLGLGNQSSRGDHANEMGDNLPAVDLGTGRTATAIAVGYRHVCALLDDGQVKCWGVGASGQLGQGTTATVGAHANEMGDALPPVDLGAGRTASAVSAGVNHTCAALDNGDVKCWGGNTSGELGLGDVRARGDGPGEMGESLPAVDLGTGRTATAVTTGGDPGIFGGGSSCAVLDDASLKCWGRNSTGQLGLGDTANRGDDPGEMGDDLAPVDPTGSGFAGAVIDSVSTVGATVPGALVAAVRTADFTIAAGDVADSTGRFTFAAPPGEYFVYVIDRTGAHLPGFVGAPTTFTVTDSIVPVMVTAPMPPTTGSISGAVTETGGGAAVPGAMVIAVDSTTGMPERVVVADGDGRYAVTGLVPGSYHVVFIDPGGGHAPRYFPSSSTPATATPVTVTSGGTAPVDQDLPKQAYQGDAAALSGRVTEEGTDQPVSGTLVLALRSSDLSFVRGVLTNGTGGYALTGPVGDYKLLFVDSAGTHAAEWWNDQPIWDLAAAGSVSAPGHADPALAPTVGSISGFVTAQGAGLGNAWVVAIGSTGVRAAAVSSPNGWYSLRGLPVDNYRVAVIDPARGAFTYWPNAATYAEAAQFAVYGGGDTPIDTSLG